MNSMYYVFTSNWKSKHGFASTGDALQTVILLRLIYLKLVAQSLPRKHRVGSVTPGICKISALPPITKKGKFIRVDGGTNKDTNGSTQILVNKMYVLYHKYILHIKGYQCRRIRLLLVTFELPVSFENPTPFEMFETNTLILFLRDR